MFYIIITAVAIVANAGIAAATLAHAKFVVSNLGEVSLPGSWLSPLAILQAAGAFGLVAGLLGVPLVGTAAAIGLVLFFVGAVVTHLRSRAYRSPSSPVLFLALAIATLAATVTR
jgi:hypothetical protein